MRLKGSEKESEDSNNTDANEVLGDAKCKILQEDLAKAMLSAAQISMKSCAEKLSEKSAVENLDQVESDDQVESEAERISNEQSECSDDDESTEEQKSKNCYVNGCCNVSYEQPEKIQ